MRSDISNAIKLKTDSRKQTTAENANPMLSLLIARKNTLLDDFSFTERRRVRRTTKDSISDVGIAVSHPKAGRDDSEVFVSYIKNSKLYMRHSLISAEVSDIDWEEIDLGEPPASKCDIAFDTVEISNRRGSLEYVTGKRPIVVFTSMLLVYYIDTSDEEMTIQQLDVFGVSDISLRQTPLGLGLFYVKSDAVYYRLYNNGSWGSETAVGVSLGHSIDGLSTFNAVGEFGIQAYSEDTGKLYRLMGDATLTWGTWAEVADASGTGAIVEYYDGKKEAFWDNGVFTYGVPASDYADQNWLFTSDDKLYDKNYSVIEFDHTNEGTVYFATVFHGSQDIIYFFRYAYMRDVSGYTQNVEQRLQTDNPITQINVTLKNIDDSLYTSEATLFAPSSIMQLGVTYGDSAIVPMGFAYIDQATVEYGGEEVTLSGRNRTGVYLKDQNFDEDMVFTDTPSRVAEDILHIFGLDDYSHIDTSGDLSGEDPVLITLEVKAKTTGLEAMETLNKIMTNDANNKQWLFEETYDGDIIVGYDEFRSGYIPKNYYTFNGRNDVFMETIDRCIDGVYNKVHVVGVTPKGKEISYTYNVTNFRFWDVGENRIYHADKIEGITKSELKKYAKALAKQLKYVGRIITYQMNLKPQLLIGDVAVITYSDDEEPDELGHITEINHTLGDDGYFTEFTITSGGNVTAVGYSAVTRSASDPQKIAYTEDKSVDGTNRIKRLADFFGAGNGGSGINSNTTIIQGDSVNLPEIIRNIGLRVLDEPKDVAIQYDAENNEVNLKWTDPDDIDTYEPVPCEWAGTVIVRNENGAPLHIWDGTIIADVTDRDEYKNQWFVDDNNIKKANLYYYGIFPYHIALDDAEHPIKHYRWTKVVSVITGSDLAPAVITSLAVNGTSIVVNFTIPTLANGAYDSITLVAKKNGTPMSADDGTPITLTASQTSATVSGLDENSQYYFVIFSEDDQDNVAVSDPKNARTTIGEGWNFDYTGAIQTFTAPKTGIYSLETWGAQGGNATDGTNTARGGYGAYAYGEMLLQQGETVYINVGGKNGYGGGGNYVAPNNNE